MCEENRCVFTAATLRCNSLCRRGNAFFQYATQACRFAWSSYEESQVMPGVLWINVTFVLSILCGVSSGIWQGCAEGAVRKANPGRFPPTPVEFAIEAWKREREEAREQERPPTTTERIVRRLSTAGTAVAAAAAMPAPRLSAVHKRGAAMKRGSLPTLALRPPEVHPPDRAAASTAAKQLTPAEVRIDVRAASLTARSRAESTPTNRLLSHQAA